VRRLSRPWRRVDEEWQEFARAVELGAEALEHATPFTAVVIVAATRQRSCARTTAAEAAAGEPEREAGFLASAHAVKRGAAAGHGECPK
jgi:hypothetical protein